MKKFTLFLALFLVSNMSSVVKAAEPYYPEPSNFVVDSANIIPDDKEQVLTDKLKEVKDSGKAEIAIVTVKTIDPLTIEEYGIKLADKWKVGDKDKDNGIILIVAVDDRKVRIEVGTGMEAVINDAKAGRILDKYAVPWFKNNQWEEGVEKTTDALIQEVGGVVSYPEGYPQTDDNSSTNGLVLLVIIIIIALILLIVFDEGVMGGSILGVFSSSGSGGGSSFSGGGFSGGGSSRGF